MTRASDWEACEDSDLGTLGNVFKLMYKIRNYKNLTLYSCSYNYFSPKTSEIKPETISVLMAYYPFLGFFVTRKTTFSRAFFGEISSCLRTSLERELKLMAEPSICKVSLVAKK